MRKKVVQRIAEETIYSYEECEFIYEFMGVLGLNQEDATRKLLQKALGLGEDPIRLLFLMLLFANEVRGGKK